MVEEIEENDEDYGNMGCQVLKRGIQHQLYFLQKSTHSQDITYCILSIDNSDVVQKLSHSMMY